jgi:hypothetical protein
VALKYTGNYGTGRVEHLRERQAAQVEAERALLRATHDRNVKLNALNKERGQGGKFCCPPSCPTCYPPDDAQGSSVGLGKIDLRDLRAGKATPKRPTGRKGRCRICGQPCPKRCYYHRRCRLEPQVAQAPPRTCRWCGRSLPENCNPQRKWCDRACESKAHRAKVKARG